ncbi:MAG TPA: choice-of-anchor P family protein [Mycobacteriales bacterium]|nr:choice-of-anchor P family protein [Mycobacteriales bacterium]
MTSTGRVARLTALALATGTLVAAGAGTAGAASKTTTSYTANGAGSVVDLKLNLPIALPGIGSTITQKLISTASNVRTTSPGATAAAVTRAVLGSEGNIPVVSQVLDRSVSSTFGGHTDSPQGDFPANPLLVGGLLQLKSLTANPDVQGLAPIASSLSSVANLKIGGAGNLQAVLDQLVSQVTTNLQGIIGTLPSGQSADSPVAGATQVVDLLGNVVNSLPVLAGTGLAPAVQDALDTVIELLNQLPTALSSKLTATTADSSLLKIGLIESVQNITHTGNTVTSHATNAIEKISLLGGLITLDSLTSDAVASLGDGAVAPSAKGTASLVKLNVEGLLNLELTGDLKAILDSGILPAAVTDAVESALNSVLDIVKSALGVALAPAEYKHSATANKASAFASPAHLVVQPAGFAKPIVDLALVPAQAEVVKAQSTTPTTVITPTKTGSRPQFAPTGANFALTAPIAVGLMGLAVVARRRRLAIEG